MHECIDLEELSKGRKQPQATALMRLASIVIASDGDEQVVLYDEGSAGGYLLTVFMEPGDVLFEQANLHDLCRKVAKIKGGCRFQIAEGQPVEQTFPNKVEPTNRIKESMPLDSAFGDDDDDSSDFWKRGDA